MTETLPPNDEGIARAAALLARGGLVALPTETVYGLGADARNEAAVAAIYAAKGRPSFNPLIVHVADAAAAEELADFSEGARLLAAAFWPGPLTLVLPRRADAGLAAGVSAGLETVALRVPAHPAARALLAAFGGPVAAPSANISGQVSPTTAAHVLSGLSGKIAAVLDAGPSAVGVESTIVGFGPDGTAQLLRPGGVPGEAIARVLGTSLASGATDAARPSAPGQLASHYAPRAGVVLNAAKRPDGALWLGFGPHCAGAELNLSESADLAEAAAGLFSALRTLDERAAPGQNIAVAPIPQEGLGVAINDRLTRAAAPRG